MFMRLHNINVTSKRCADRRMRPGIKKLCLSHVLYYGTLGSRVVPTAFVVP